MADYFRRRKISESPRLQREARAPFYQRLKRRLLSSHPDYDNRIDELTK